MRSWIATRSQHAKPYGFVVQAFARVRECIAIEVKMTDESGRVNSGLAREAVDARRLGRGGAFAARGFDEPILDQP
jgi:hypothetical protein